MITLTETAIKQIEKSIAARGHGLGIRIGLKKSGCSGYAYTLEYVDEFKSGDQIFGPTNATVAVHVEDFIYLDGMELDYVKTGLNEGFEFKNPNVTAECGCGESFSVS